MSFTPSTGTRGGRVPRGPFMRLVNSIVACNVRKKGPVSYTHLTLPTILRV